MYSCTLCVNTLHTVKLCEYEYMLQGNKKFKVKKIIQGSSQLFYISTQYKLMFLIFKYYFIPYIVGLS